MQRCREGINDRAYFYTLEQLADQLELGSYPQAAQQARDTLQNICQDIPLPGDELDSYTPTSYIVDQKLWAVVRAIQDARSTLGQSVDQLPQNMPRGRRVVPAVGLSSCPSLECEPLPADLSDDCEVTLVDAAIVASNWLNSTISSFSNTCNSLSQFDDTGMNLTILSGGPSGNYLRATSTAADACIEWEPNGGTGIDVLYGNIVAFEAEGYVEDIQVVARIDGSPYTLKPYTREPLPGQWTTYQLSIPIDGNLSKVEYSVLLSGQQFKLDNLEIICIERDKGDINWDLTFDFADFAELVESWLECTRPDCL